MKTTSLTDAKLDLSLEKYNLDDYALEKLNLNNLRIEKGTEDIVTTPLVKNLSVEEVISGWTKVFKGNIDKVNDVLEDIEDKQKDKIAARSQAKPWSENDGFIYNYFDREQPTYVYYPSLSYENVLRPLELTKAVELLKNNTASGLPWMLKTGDVKLELVNKAKLDQLIAEDYPCVLFTRTQEGWKTRYVWGYPKANATFEMTVYKPLQAVQKKLKWRAALVGPDATDEAITKMINYAIEYDFTIMSVDFTAYDASVSTNEVFNAFEYIKSKFQKQTHEDINKMRDYFYTCPVLTPDGIIRGKHGIPSGSVFTNEIGSIVQYQLYEDTGLVNMEHIQCQGDDGAILIPDELVDDLINVLPKYGKETNKSKCTIAKDWIVFLQNLYHIDYMKEGLIGGIYPTYRALCRLIYQERWSDFQQYGLEGKDFYSIRTIMVLENCKFHPLFEEFVEYIWSLDKYKLAYSDEGLSKFIRMISDKQGKSGIVDNQYGDNVKGIANFATTKVLLRLNG